MPRQFSFLSLPAAVLLAASVLHAQAPLAAAWSGLPPAPAPANSAPALPSDAELVRRLLERNHQMERLLLGSLQVDATEAVIDDELEHMRVVRANLSARRDKAQNKINIGTLAANVLSTTGTAMQFHDSTVNLGNGIGVAGGAAAIILSVIGMHEQGGKLALGDSPRVLANVLGHTPDDSRGEIAPLVWEYLNAVPAGQPPAQTRRAQLIEKWRVEGKLDVAAQPGQPLRRQLSLDEFNTHYTMLLDLKAVVSGMKRELSGQAESLVQRPVSVSATP